MSGNTFRKGSIRNKFTTEQIIQTAKDADNNLLKAAKALGVAKTTVWDWFNKPEKFLIPTPTDEPPNNHLNPHSQRFVITCAQNNTQVHTAFLNSLLSYCQHNQCQLVVLPIRYKNVNAYCPTDQYTVQWPSELHQFYVNSDIELCPRLMLMGGFNIAATALNPLSGIGPVAGNKSAIFGHHQVAMEVIPTPHHEHPRMLLTTGSVSVENYSSSKQGALAKFHHSLGALLVELGDQGEFYVRQLSPTQDGSFYDLDTLYQPAQPPDSGHRASGIVYGDSHIDSMDQQVRDATWESPTSITSICRPEHHYIHDALDFYSANHHHKDNQLVRYAKHQAGAHNVQRELDRLVACHNKIWSDSTATYHYIESNHNLALTKWLQSADPKQDPENALIYHKLMVEVLSNTTMTPSGAAIPNPLALYVMPRIVNPNNTIFHKRDDKVELFDIDLSQHGDIGINGARGSVQAFARSGRKSVTGHGHSPKIEKGAYRVGTSSLLKLEYNQGYSSWMHCHCIIYPNGKRTLIYIINGRWRL
jgi:hypothetical protein